ncbi:hypothetical protein [Bradyrhizobium sp.]|uniref:hypothetical protein n=1 Tax=Bradyrhizobium sp. TaxID=376 RepID=UPI003C60D64D
MIKQRGSIMPALFDFLYREYCRTRLAEMRKQHLLVDSREVLETNCDADNADGAADRGGDSAGKRHESNQAGLI